MEGGCAFFMKGTPAGVASARSPQRHICPDNIDDINPVFYLLNFIRSHNAKSIPLSKKPAACATSFLFSNIFIRYSPRESAGRGRPSPPLDSRGGFSSLFFFF